MLTKTCLASRSKGEVFLGVRDADYGNCEKWKCLDVWKTRLEIISSINLLHGCIIGCNDENIVIDLVTGDTKLIDFGAATVLKKSHYTDFQGTRLYCPPEWFLHSLYLGKEAAVWSLGVLLYNALNGRLPFKNEKDICTAHLLGPLPFYTSVSAEAKDLIARCLAFDPFSRCSLEEILKHPWVTKHCADWLTLSAQAGKNLTDKPKEDERDHSEEFEEIVEDTGKEEKDDEEERGEEDDDDDDDVASTEAESGVGSSASSSTGKTAVQSACGTIAIDRHPSRSARLFDKNQPEMQATPPARFSKTSLLAAPSSDEIKAVVHASKTKSVYHGTGTPLRPSRRHVPPPNSAVLTALRRAMSRDRQIRA
ncbi:hypothetical protein Y032_0017g3470 [Ancylostoma ceylanicum]|uniref:non-specific serine/threonine protein kinase n=1 Tax=Ancylostoma ceylanicum TaxID=53326 RepID=A0A016V4Q6_9BILA|nr:hypothetical protein Y032_0017g3470 [Ancylostoma ceylanicum]